jgi:mRNA-degrading endonuclease RelE of RelBE toxin-antitoxin system
MHKLKFTPDALEDLRWLRKYDQKLIVDRLEEQLHADPTVETRHRKPMRPNEIASWGREYQL